MNKTYKYLGAGAGTVVAGLIVIISCPPQWFDDDDAAGSAGVAGFSGSAGSGTGGVSGQGGNSGSGSAGAGGLPQHPCNVTGEHPNISNAEQLCDLVKSASHCIGVDPNVWTCYCEADLVTNGCQNCLIAFADGVDLSASTLSQFTQVLGAGHSECVRCPQGHTCTGPNSCSSVGPNRSRAIVVETNNCMQ